MISNVFSGIDSTFLFQSLDGNASIWTMVQAAANGVFRTLALMIMLCLIMVEFLSISDRYSSNQLNDMLKPIAMLFAKCALMITLIQTAVPFLNIVVNGFLDAQTRLADGLSASFATMDMSELNGIVDNMAFGTQIVAIVVLLLVVLMAYVVSLFVKIIALGRLIQLYLLIAVSPMPLATLGNHELSQIGKNYLKSFVSCCVQGIILVLVLNLLPAFSTLILSAGQGNGVLEGIAAVFSMLGSTLVLIGVFFVSIKGSKKLADTVCGAM